MILVKVLGEFAKPFDEVEVGRVWWEVFEGNPQLLSFFHNVIRLDNKSHCRATPQSCLFLDSLPWLTKEDYYDLLITAYFYQECCGSEGLGIYRADDA